MLRLALEAEVANLQAEADALIAEATVEGHAPEGDARRGCRRTVVGDLREVRPNSEDVDEALDTDPLTDGDRQPV